MLASRVKQIGWFIGLWALSVASLSVVGLLIKWVLA